MPLKGILMMEKNLSLYRCFELSKNALKLFLIFNRWNLYAFFVVVAVVVVVSLLKE